jgi:hypothetical protein
VHAWQGGSSSSSSSSSSVDQESYLAHLKMRLAAVEAQAAEERGKRLALEAQMGVEGACVREGREMA